MWIDWRELSLGNHRSFRIPLQILQGARDLGSASNDSLSAVAGLIVGLLIQHVAPTASGSGIPPNEGGLLSKVWRDRTFGGNLALRHRHSFSRDGRRNLSGFQCTHFRIDRRPENHRDSSRRLDTRGRQHTRHQRRSSSTGCQSERTIEAPRHRDLARHCPSAKCD